MYAKKEQTVFDHARIKMQFFTLKAKGISDGVAIDTLADETGLSFQYLVKLCFSARRESIPEEQESLNQTS